MNQFRQKKTRVAYLIDTIARKTAGTEKQLIQTIENIDRGMVEPYLVCLWRSPWMERNVLPCPIKILGFRGFIKSNIFQVLSELRRFIRKEEIRIVHVFFVDSIFVAYLAWLTDRIHPILVSSRRDIGVGDEPWYHVAYNYLLPYVNRRFTAVVANSRNVKEHVVAKEHLPEEKTRIIYNGIDVEIESGEVVLPPEGGSGIVRIGLSASLKKVKRVDLFLKAFRILKDSVTEIRVEGLILGDGPEREKLVAMATCLGIHTDVLFAGEVSDVLCRLRKVDIGVLCSDREGLSNAILEYMSCGLPVVATAVGGTPELVEEGNGICIPPGDPEALAEALRILVVSPETRRRMGVASLEKAKSQFSWKRSNLDLQELYQELSSNNTNDVGEDRQTSVVNGATGR